MDFLSTPLPTNTGTEEQFVKQKPCPSTWMLGSKQSESTVLKKSASLTKHKWGGKTAQEWTKILNGDYWTIITHIKNGTMEEYHTYREWKTGVRPKRNQDRIKRFMTPRGIMTYAEAKLAFGFRDSEAIRNRIRSTKPEYDDWYFVDNKVDNAR
jgi:hypothetical protein